MQNRKAGNVSARSKAGATAAAVAFALAACAPQTPRSEHEVHAATEPRVQPAPKPGVQAASEVPAARPVPEPRPARHADFGRARAGDDARHIADWVVDSGDNRNAPFLIIDKMAAQAYMFDRSGKLVGTAPVLLGLAKGDDTPPGIGDKPLSAIRAHERITGAGRYVGELGYNLRGEDVLWVDYDTGLSLHRVLTTNSRERRAHRLATPTPLDNRVSYGCINVPVRFFEQVIRPTYRGTKGMVYVLPETRPARVVFGSYDANERARVDAAARSTRQAAAARLPR